MWDHEAVVLTKEAGVWWSGVAVEMAVCRVAT